MEKSKNHPQSLLEAVFNFTPEELELNRQGYLSERQKKRIQTKEDEELGCCCFVVIGAITIAFGFSSMILSQIEHPQVVYALLASLVIIGVLSAIGSLRHRNNVNKLVQLRCVKNITGMIILGTGTRNNKGENTVNYYFRIDNYQFSLTGEQFYALKNGSPYRLYYIPRYSNNLVSVEEFFPPPDDLPY